MNVACPGRHVDEEIIQIAPPRICYELFEGVAGHCASPKHGCILIDHKPDTEHLHSIFLYGFNPVATLFVDHIKLFILHSEHLRHRGSENIGIKKTDLITFSRQSYRHVSSDCRLSYSTFTGRDSYDILHSRKRLFRFWRRSLAIFHRDAVFGIYFRRNIGFQGSLSRTDHTLDEGVGRFVEYQGKTNLITINPDIILHHAVLHDILPVAGIFDILERIKNKIRI